MIGLLLSLAISASAAEVPFFNREVKSARDVGSLNENFRATSDAIRKSDLTNGGTIDGTATIDQVCFPDGTCQTTAPTAIAHSTWSVVEMCGGDQTPAATTKATAEAVTGSTVTVTIQAGSMVEACIFGGYNCAGAQCGMDIRIDGASFTAGGTVGIPLNSAASSVDDHLGACIPIAGLSAAQHSFTLNVWRGGNPLVLRKANPCLTFYVREVQVKP